MSSFKDSLEFGNTEMLMEGGDRSSERVSSTLWKYHLKPFGLKSADLKIVNLDFNFNDEGIILGRNSITGSDTIY